MLAPWRIHLQVSFAFSAKVHAFFKIWTLIGVCIKVELVILLGLEMTNTSLGNCIETYCLTGEADCGTR